jgi:hypothetical protein
VRGRRRRRCREDHVPNAFDISEHFIIPEAQDAIAVVDEPSISDSVSRVRRVLTTIDFDNESFFSADEIDDVGTDCFLPHEFESAEASGAQVFPKFALGEGRVLS